MITTTGTNFTNDVWHHVALVRDVNNTVDLYVDGALQGTVSPITTQVDITKVDIATGPYYGLTEFAGFITNVRIIKGDAMYTSSFTPSRDVLKYETGTELLLNPSGSFVFDSSAHYNVSRVNSPTYSAQTPIQLTTISFFANGVGTIDNIPSINAYYGADVKEWQYFQDAVGDGANWTVSGPTGVSCTISNIFASVDAQYTDRHSISVALNLNAGATLVQGATYTFHPPQSVPCFVEGTRILTPEGYRAIETLSVATDLVLTSDGRAIPFKRTKSVVKVATAGNAPYLIEPNAFGEHNPAFQLRLSPIHKVQIRPGVWTSPSVAAKTNPLVKQYGLGEPVTYYHIECADYFTDDLVAEGAIVESLGRPNKFPRNFPVFSWKRELGGFIRNTPPHLSIDPNPNPTR